ncbi:hypothetical protein [Rhizorhabdus dicambivorans]|uniref:Sulfur globule protein n=1 Tax=Rhizorhabdus dicambivorans TaxID=1850238 RepID=A0A2A4FPU3_9SPHN|nr:hypothetical protein [Rhizorhabdus dicambivorans]ATE64793.1 hypothetical protein CMV14_10615 [Rhizorhabdus dicambivorans]PCE39734.1 hypothetical protein COO09_24015 [Rhizorhabdus dicambivorans]
MRIKTVLIGVAALAATAVPAVASAQTSFGISISSGRGYYGSPYGYSYDYGRYGYPYRYDRHDRYDRRHWDRGRHKGWYKRHRNHDHDRWDRR